MGIFQSQQLSATTPETSADMELPESESVEFESNHVCRTQERISMSRQYHYQRSDNIEDIEDYRPGGYHPVELGDVIENQYEVMLKLGHGGFSTVWLVHDTSSERFLAMKIVMAEASEEAFETEKRLDEFEKSVNADQGFVGFSEARWWFQGPNGNHLAILSNWMGPSVAKFIEVTRLGTISPEYSLNGKVAQRLALQITQAVSSIHNRGIAHGDLTCSNVLLAINNLKLNNRSPREILNLVRGSSSMEQITRIDGKPNKPTAPDYVYEGEDMAIPLLPFWTGDVKVIDFGSSYPLDSPPADLQIPYSSCSPEYLLLQKVGKESDIWALGVLIYKLRSGKDLFAEVMGGDAEVIFQMEEVLGPIPYNKGPTVTTPERISGDADEAVTGFKPLLRELIDAIDDNHLLAHEDDGNRTRNGGGDSREEKAGEEGVLRTSQELPPQAQDHPGEEENVRPDPMLSTKKSGKEVQSTKISPWEAELLYDLLSGSLNYDVEKRLNADQMLRHPWFSMNFE
ncbi:kinase-like protein [Mollisia scopiformis]|uniref:Kinase-like protein n=1 Tax=Mollisia scopiformis TaxID=149040 RepID=A0A194X449_MOLSC|nr:kinase-like protein [Mollisia scopiformis]KUJ14951.1 kinase-like protein [Mollisia scopiformis]